MNTNNAKENAMTGGHRPPGHVFSVCGNCGETWASASAPSGCCRCAADDISTTRPCPGCHMCTDDA